MQSDADEVVPTEGGDNNEAGEAARHELLEIAKRRDIVDRAKKISERISKVTPPPKPPSPEQDSN